MTRLLEITVCLREPGKVILPVERGNRPAPMNARAIVNRLERLIAGRRLTGVVWVREGCAGGCARAGPNVNVDVFARARPGEAQDHIAIAGKSYVYSLRSLRWLGQIIDENLEKVPGTFSGPGRGRRRGRSGRRPERPRC